MHRSRQEDHTEALTERQALALLQPHSARVAGASMPDAENKLRTANNNIQNNQTVLSHERLHLCVTHQSSSLAGIGGTEVIYAKHSARACVTEAAEFVVA